MTQTHSTPDLWHTMEKQGDKVLHVIHTRDTATAKACMAGVELLEALKGLLVFVPEPKGFTHPFLDAARAAIAKAEGK